MNFGDVFAYLNLKDVDEPEVATEKILDYLCALGEADLREELHSLVLREVTHYIRMETQAVERSIIRPRSGAKGADPLASRSKLHELSFYSSRCHGRVKWGEALIEDHQSRIDMMRGQISGIQETIDMHEEAIANIKKVPGANRLNDTVKAKPTRKRS